MGNKGSEDPRSVRARQALHQALIDLLRSVPYQKITVTDISLKSGHSRHTFYNHYDSKDDLLDSVIDKILEDFFVNIGPWISVTSDPEGNKKVGQRFFEVWQEHADVVRILNAVDIDCLLIGRLKSHFTKYFDQYIRPTENAGASRELTAFIISLLAYSYAGVLRQWLLFDMRYSPEVMGRFLNYFTGLQTRTVLQEFRGEIR